LIPAGELSTHLLQAATASFVNLPFGDKDPGFVCLESRYSEWARQDTAPSRIFLIVAEAIF